MKRWGIAAVVFALVLGTAVGQDEKVPSNKDVMGKLNKGPNCLKAQLGKELKAETPDWPAVQKESKEFLAGADALSKNTPTKGDKDSWAKLTKTYKDDAQSLAAAADKKDKDAAVAAFSKLDNNRTCMGCHQAHRGR